MGAIDEYGSTDIGAVRFLVGDRVSPYQLTDAEVEFALTQTSNNTYLAAAFCARALSAFYARRVDTRFETIDSKYSQLRDSYERLARSLESQGKKQGGLGLPVGGGLTRSDVDAVRADTNRIDPFFYDNIFQNPPRSNDNDDVER
jgi:hypothetical protein